MTNANTSAQNISHAIDTEQLADKWGHMILWESLDLVEMEQVLVDPEDVHGARIWLYTYQADVIDYAELEYQFGDRAESSNEVYIVGSGDCYFLELSAYNAEQKFWDRAFEPEMASYVQPGE